MEEAECPSNLTKASIKMKNLFDKSGERSLDRSAIVAVIESPEWDEEDEEIDKEIRKVIGEDGERDTEPEENNEMGVIRVLPGRSEEEVYRSNSLDVGKSRNSGIVTLPRVSTWRLNDDNVITFLRVMMSLLPGTEKTVHELGKDS